MNPKYLDVNDLEPLVDRIEHIASVLDELLQAHCLPFDPSPETFARLGTELRADPGLSEWLQEIRSSHA